MVYCDGVEVDSKLGRLIQAFRCDRPSEWQMDEFIQMAEDMHKEITRLREAEKDAERCRRMYDSALREAKQQYEWRMEDSECGGNEVSEGLYMLECRVNRQAMKEKDDE